MFCQHCGARLDADSRFCSGCGAPVEPEGEPRQGREAQPSRSSVYRQPGGRDPAFGRRSSSRRKSPVKAGFQARIFGIPISGKGAIILLIILVIVCVILNKTGVLN